MKIFKRKEVCASFCKVPVIKINKEGNRTITLISFELTFPHFEYFKNSPTVTAIHGIFFSIFI